MRIVLLGAPGAGKGTQCKRVVDRYGLRHLSSGDILRRHRAEKSELGERAAEYMDSGGLVPDNIIVEMMAGEISGSDRGFVLDGFPRTAGQASELDKLLKRAGCDIDLILNLEIDDDIVRRRMTGRRSCPKCGAVYHVENLPPRVEGVCDNDGSPLSSRPDDRPEVVENRLLTYHRDTEPVIDYYGNGRTLIDIDASADADEVTLILFSKLDALAGDSSGCGAAGRVC